MQISVVIATFNEEESLPELTSWIVKVMTENNLTYEVIYVDDGSTDKSWPIIDDLSKENPSIKGIKFRRNYGKSAALNRAFDAAQGDVIITMDADLQDSPDEIPELYRMIVEDGFDLVSGWKKKRHDPLSKTIPTKLYNAATRRMTKTGLHDMNCGLKSYRKDVIKTVEVYGEMHRYIPIIAKASGFSKIDEKVVIHQKRKYGVTKFGMDRFIKGYLDLLSINFVSRFAQRPMHFFGSLGTIIFFVGFVIASYLAYAKFFMEGYRMTERPLFFFGLLAMMIDSQLFLSGILAEMISRNSREKSNYQIRELLNIDSKIKKQE